MNRAQRTTLLMVVGIDALLISYPPFEERRGWRTFDLGYDWLPTGLFGDAGASINFGTLAGEIAIVTLIGFTIFVLARGASDERGVPIASGPSAFRGPLHRMLRFVSANRLPIGVLAGLVLGGCVGFGLILEAMYRKAQEATAVEAQRAANAAAEQAAELRRRTTAAGALLTITSKNIECSLSTTTCPMYQLVLSLMNQSRETITAIYVGWSFLPSGTTNCPSTYVTKHVERVNLSPQGTITLNMQGFDGPDKQPFSYCVGITGITIRP